jgi:hypothetical protein
LLPSSAYAHRRSNWTARCERSPIRYPTRIGDVRTPAVGPICLEADTPAQLRFGTGGPPVTELTIG